MSEPREKFHYARHDGTWAIETVQDVQPYLDANKRMYNENQVLRKHNLGSHVLGEKKAAIPPVVWHQFLNEFKETHNRDQHPRWNDPEFKMFLSKKLRDRDNRYLRVDGRKD